MAGGASFSSQSRGFLHIFMDMTLFLEPLSFVSRAFLLSPSFAKRGTLASPFIKGIEGGFLYVISHLTEMFVNYFFGYKGGSFKMFPAYSGIQDQGRRKF